MALPRYFFLYRKLLKNSQETEKRQKPIGGTQIELLSGRQSYKQALVLGCLNLK